MKIKHIESTFHFDKSLNEEIEKIEKGDGIILDIKYSSNGVDNSNTSRYSALIIYCTKSEYREVKINKLLEDQ